MRRVWGPQLLDDHTICFGTFQEELLQSFLQVEQGRNALGESLTELFCELSRGGAPRCGRVLQVRNIMRVCKTLRVLEQQKIQVRRGFTSQG